MLGNTGRWTDSLVEDAIDAEGSVPAACVLLLESAATAASFDADVKAGSQAVSQAHVAGALFKAAQRIRDDYDLPGAAGSVGVMMTSTARPVLGGPGCVDANGDPIIDGSCSCGELYGCGACC